MRAQMCEPLSASVANKAAWGVRIFEGLAATSVAACEVSSGKRQIQEGILVWCFVGLTKLFSAEHLWLPLFS